MALMKVMYENGIDAFVHAENTVPTPKLLGPNVGTASLDGITPFFQIPKIVVPAGFTQVEVAPAFALNDGKNELHVNPAGGGEADGHGAPDADCDHVLCRAGGGTDAHQGRDGVRVGDPSSQATAGVWPDHATNALDGVSAVVGSYRGARDLIRSAQNTDSTVPVGNLGTNRGQQLRRAVPQPLRRSAAAT